MTQQVWRKGRVMVAGLLGVAMLTLVGMWGCGTDGYSNPSDSAVTTKTATALIQASDLKEWMDAGLVNKAGGYDRVVILSIASTKDVYDRGHIPGAIYVDPAELLSTGIEGVAASSTMVADGAKMDALIRRCGINEYTTVVFTAPAGDPAYNPTRAYTTFRYWGFPKSRLKVLDGWDNGWKLAEYLLTSETPRLTASKYGVTPNDTNRVQADLRASLGEMIAAAKAFDSASMAIIDTRTGGAYNGVAGSTPGVFAPNANATITTDYTVFEGHIVNAVALPYTDLYEANKKFYPVDDETHSANTLLKKFADKGVTAEKTSYVYCRTGYIASTEFFVLDGILGWNVVWYDGSWSQWGQMATSNSGKLATGSAWDTTSLTTALNYNLGKTVGTTTLTANHIEALPIESNLEVLYTTFTDPRANQIEMADKAYRSPIITSTAGDRAAGGGGGC